jgi:hypothetical protein
MVTHLHWSEAKKALDRSGAALPHGSAAEVKVIVPDAR